jgi:anthranilate/para-aminobenzoate synthase component I
MSQYQCSKCGASAYSKCARSRNVFPDNMTATMLSNITEFAIDRSGAFPKVKIEMGYLDDATDIELYSKVIKSLYHHLEKGDIAQATCSHKWELVDEECEIGCCSRL